MQYNTFNARLGKKSLSNIMLAFILLSAIALVGFFLWLMQDNSEKELDTNIDLHNRLDGENVSTYLN